MRVDPAIAGLRSELTPQPCTDAALAAWRGSAQGASVAEGLARWDGGAALADLPALAQLLGDHAAAQAFAASMITPLLASLQAEPLAQLPLGHACAPGMTRLRLASHGRTALSLLAVARREQTMPVSALFEDGEVHEIILAGAGEALVHRLTSERLESETVALAPGTRLVRNGPDTARQITGVTRPLLLLQCVREPANPAPSREIALADGRLLKTISACKRTSQQIMALAVLGALEHRPALPDMARLARDGSAPRDLRWEALRHTLALDAGEGLAVLAAVAGDPADALCGAATALQAQLLASRPELAALIKEPA
jgi:hypothetical protein